MRKDRLESRYRIKRNAIGKDVRLFGIPALIAFALGLVLSARDGYSGLVRALWDLLGHPSTLTTLPPEQVASLSLLVVGLTICFIAVGTLRVSYSSSLVIREGHRLVTHGVYRYVRHPVYLGALTVCLSVPLYALSLPGFVAMATLVPLVLNRIRMEEQLLIDEFGDAYRTYQQSTRKLIPFLY